MDINQLLDAIRKEAADVEPILQNVSASALWKPRLDVKKEVEGLQYSALADLPVKSRYDIKELVVYDDGQFVRNVFMAILQRQPDDRGYADYLGLLRTGISKSYIICSVSRSAEARNLGVRINGLLPAKVIFVLEKLPKSFRRVTKPVVGFISSLFGLEPSHEERAMKASHKQLEKTFEQLKKVLLETERRLEQLESAAQNTATVQSVAAEKLANIQHRLTYQAQMFALAERDPVNNLDPAKPVLGEADVDAFYVAFEDACRGSREEIETKLRAWIDYLPDLHNQVKHALDIGCGRGEWLRLLTDRGYSAKGLDVNPIMVQSCCDNGLDAEQIDALGYLQAQKSGSHALISAFHVVEHIPFEVLLRWTAEAYRVLEEGGVLIYETPNPENPLVGSHTFYHDPTHRNPITPTLLRFLAEYCGFEQVEIRRLHPYPEEARVKGIDALTERVNGLLCGPQDFALVATKRCGAN